MISYLQQQANPRGVLSYRDYIHHCLYAPSIGYYQQKRHRVGRCQHSDFFTAYSLQGDVFAQLILASIQSLLGLEQSRHMSFVEIGAEPQQSLAPTIASAFAHTHSLPLGSTSGPELKLPTPSILFSNELFDAQPFHRLVYLDDHWHELGVRIDEQQQLHEVCLHSEESTLSPQQLASLPPAPDNGYRLDHSWDAPALLQQLLSPDWQGLFIAMDYGKSRQELWQAHPQGTARCYYQHKQSNDLLAHPGQQDITYHVNWDDLADTLRHNHCTDIQEYSMESFFIHHASSYLEQTFQTPGFNADKQSLHQLLHPANMGQKFQVLIGRRL